MDGSAVEKIESLAKNSVLHEVDGKKFSIHKLIPVSDNREAEALKVNTLSAIKTYITDNIDADSIGKMFVHVVDHETVVLRSYLNRETRGREAYLVAEPFNTEQDFNFNSFMALEPFKIGLLSLFIQNPDRDKLIDFVSRVSVKDNEEIEDDGVAQKVTASRGVGGHMRDKETAPQTMKLKPFRTFTEVEQPESEFVVRLKHDKYEGVKIGLFASDGGAWKKTAMESVKKWLTDEIEDLRIIC